MASRLPLRSVSAAPRSHLFTRLSTTRATRPFSNSHVIKQDQSSGSGSSQPFGGIGAGPSPPRLPKEEQEIFEALQRQSTGAFSTPRTPPQINQSPDSSAADRAQAETKITDRVDKLSGQDPTRAQNKFKEQLDKVIEARGKGEELHPNVRRGAQPEFEGEKNPKTGEVGGPKNEPLRWGAAGEWSYNGRTTDF